MSLHFHGTPLTPRHMLERMTGEHFCVSFAEPRDVDVCLRIGQSVIFDNGEFKARKTRIEAGHAKTDWSDYYAWLRPRLAPPHFAVIPDVIDGTVDQQRELVAQWPFHRSLGAPVWHMALPISYLIELALAWPRICFGSSGELWQIGTKAWCDRMTEAFEALYDADLMHVWVHGLRMLDILGDPRWPLVSADSVNVARNYKDSGVDPVAMARRINASNSPAKFTPPKPMPKTEIGDFLACSE